MRRWLNEEYGRVDRQYREADTGYRKKHQRWIASGQKGPKPRMGKLDSAFARAERLCLEILDQLDAVDIDTRTRLGHAFNQVLAEFDAAARPLVPGQRRADVARPARDWKPVVRKRVAWLEMTAGGGKYLTSYEEIKQILEKRGCQVPSRSLLNRYRKKLRQKKTDR